MSATNIVWSGYIIFCYTDGYRRICYFVVKGNYFFSTINVSATYSVVFGSSVDSCRCSLSIDGVGLDIFMVAFYEYCTKLWYHHTFFFIFNGF